MNETPPEQTPATPPPVNNQVLPPNIAATLAYAFTFVSGIIFWATSTNKFVRFHAIQSTLLFGGLSIVYYLLATIGIAMFGYTVLILSSLLKLASLILWIILMIKAYNNQQFKLPIIGDFAEGKA